MRRLFKNNENLDSFVVETDAFVSSTTVDSDAGASQNIF